MHIVHLADAVFRDKPGGSRQYAREVARQMRAQGHDITFLVPRLQAEWPENEVVDGQTVVRYAGGGVLARQRALQRAFLTLHRERPVDAVIVHFAYTAWGYHRLAVSTQIPTLRVFHGPWDTEAQAEAGGAGGLRAKTAARLRHMVEKFSLTRSHRVVTLSEFMAHDARERFQVAASKIAIIPGGVDAARFAPGDRQAARQSLGLPADAFLSFTARRLVRRMGLDALIEAVALARCDIPNLRVCIAGKGPLQQELADLIAARGLSEVVQLVGFVPDAVLPDYYRAADVFVLPTQALEGFGLIILEALACGTPVLGTPVGAIADVLSAFDTRLVLPGTRPEQIAQGLVDFYHRRNQPAPDYRSLVENGYTWAQITDRLLEELRRTHA